MYFSCTLNALNNDNNITKTTPYSLDQLYVW